MGAPDPLPKVKDWDWKVLMPTVLSQTTMEVAAWRSKWLEVVQGFDLKMQNYELNRILPDNVELLQSWLDNKDISIERKEKVVEVMILRGANDRSLERLKDAAAHGYRAANDGGQLTTVERLKYEEANRYQMAARGAVLNGGAAMFDQLSKSPDNLPSPPSGRPPATEWVNTMLRDGGLMGDHEHRQGFEQWVKGLPPETQGRVLFHLADAAGTKDYDEHAHVTGFEVSVEPVGFGLQWDRAPDSHWEKVGSDVHRGVLNDLKGSEARAAYSKGFQAAKMSAPE